MQETVMATKDFLVFDSGSRVVEPPALGEKYLDPEYRWRGKHALWRQEGRTGAYLKVNGEIFRDKGNLNLPRHALAAGHGLGCDRYPRPRGQTTVALDPVCYQLQRRY
jgi:hypothetical protein